MTEQPHDDPSGSPRAQAVGDRIRAKLDEPSLIRFDHDPEQRGERAGVEGEYRLAAEHDGTHLAIDLAITVELPFPHVAGPAVRAAMKGVVAGMGYRFSTNLVRHLGG